MGPRTGNNGSLGSAWNWFPLIPVILILLLNFMPSSQPIYSLSPLFSYEHRFTTQKGVNFYVNSATFEVDYPPNTPVCVALEEQVERGRQRRLVNFADPEVDLFTQMGLSMEYGFVIGEGGEEDGRMAASPEAGPMVGS
ncbi:hypothetical protein Vadar_013051 [Vaccinium darrowii]|uniref:Uncharacterized protein n=1 Tax=Vaccinium darrowii TaxID=229202 RepID=A0ACB7X9U1_9ERIC|nr:hypothetical protein Vadar_013051 [Vaccinium darrowii]